MVSAATAPYIRTTRLLALTASSSLPLVPRSRANDRSRSTRLAPFNLPYHSITLMILFFFLFVLLFLLLILALVLSLLINLIVVPHKVVVHASSD